MRVILRQTFPLGRYHANPWRAFAFDDPHGEWPPSPWRLLRATLARSFQLSRERENVDDDGLRQQLVRAFCQSQFSWNLPTASWRGPGLKQYQPADFEASHPEPRDFIAWQIDESSKLAFSALFTLPVDAFYFAHYKKINVIELFNKNMISVTKNETTPELRKVINDVVTEKLKGQKPKDFWLPKKQKVQQEKMDARLAELGGTRFKHYFPDAKTYNPTKNKDNFWLIPPEQSLFWILEGEGWTEAVLAHLDDCLARVTYFGRAESLTAIDRVDESNFVEPHANVVIKLSDTRSATAVPVLCPQKEATFEQVVSQTHDSAVANSTTPPGAVWKYAERPARPKPVARQPQRKPLPPVQVVQFAIGGRVFPPLPFWIRITERFRVRVIHTLKKRNGDSYDGLSLFTGKNIDGSVLAGHSHAAFFLVPDSRGNPSRLICWRKEPFSDEEQTALLDAAELPIAWDFKSDDWKLRLVPLPGETPLAKSQDIFAESRVWESLTPFVPLLHVIDRRGKPKKGYEIETQIKNMLIERGIPAPTAIDDLSDGVAWVKVHRPRRSRDGQTNDDKRAFRIRLTFAEPISGPLFIGHSCHFGLGLFGPC
jgi:CRISPR-associated protein Csb2